MRLRLTNVPTALHLPFAESDAKQVGPRLFRKQILPVGSLEYKGRKLDFTQDYLNKLHRNFAAGKFDQVPFLLVNDKNEHVDDPEKYRGELKATELASDGLYGIFELSEEGVKLVHDNPKLGVSPRIREDVEAIEHVAGTLRPRTEGMGVKPWEQVELSGEQEAVDIVDLTDEKFAEAGSPGGSPSSSTVSDGLSDAEQTQLAELAKKGGEDAARIALKEAGVSEDKVQEAIDQILGDAETTEPDKEPVAALSTEDRQAIELANSNAKAAQEDARKAREELATARFETRRNELLQAGVPPADIDLAEPVLRGDSGVIELSNGTKVDAQDVVTKLLENRKGTVDLSVVGAGADTGDDNSEAAEARRKADEWERSSTGAED